MRTLTQIRIGFPNEVQIIESGEDGFRGLLHCLGTQPIRFIASWGDDWDHVSLSLSHRCPTWDEMNYAKRIFFSHDECVMQLHPPEKDYIDCHPHCLHLWRPQKAEIPRPPGYMVGPSNPK